MGGRKPGRTPTTWKPLSAWATLQRWALVEFAADFGRMLRTGRDFHGIALTEADRVELRAWLEAIRLELKRRNE